VQLAIPSPALVLLVGPSGAGKSTFARAHFRPIEIISPDELRERVADDPNDQDASADAFRILALLLNGRLKRRLTSVVDATNLRARNRKRLASLASRYGVPVVAIVFDLPEQSFFDNNSRRPDRRVDEDVIANQLELMRQALRDIPSEGYAQVHVVGR
jgi:protein phosphatase